MPSLGRPGIYLQESTVQQTTTDQSRTDAIAVFIGSIARGPITPQLVSSWTDFVRIFGGLDYSYPTTIAAYMFFTNGGRDAYIRRVVASDAVTATKTLQDSGSADSVTVKASNAGTWGNTIAIEVTASDSVSKRFSLAVYGPALTTTGSGLRSNLLEQFNDLSLDSTNSRYALSIVNNFSNYIKLTAISGNTAFNPPAVTGSVIQLSTGSDGSTITGADISATFTDFDIYNTPMIFNAPDIAKLVSSSATKIAGQQAQSALLRYAESRGDGFVIVDTPSGLSPFEAGVYATELFGIATSASATTTQFTITAATPSTPSAGSVQYTTGTSQHGFVVGSTVTITGVTSQATISGTIANQVKPGYQGTTQVAGFVNYTTAAAHGFKTGDTVTIAGISNTITGNATTNTAYNGNYTITVVDSTNFYVANATTDGVLSYTSGSSATVTGQGYSGKYTIVTVPSATTFTVNNAGTGTALFNNAKATVTNTWSTAVSSGANAAIYYPWLAIPDNSQAIAGVTRNVAPGGAIAGVYQSTDASRGVFKSPAGYDASVDLAVDLEIDSAGKPRRLTNDGLDLLNTNAVPVNPIRIVPGAGMVVMGARTMSSTSPNRYINMRRSMIYIKKQIELRSQFAVFENNDEFLWRQLRSSLSNFLNMYWQQGGLRGASPEQAFFVKCDASTTSDLEIANGVVNIRVGVALEYPAEFIVINIGQLTGSATAF